MPTRRSKRTLRKLAKTPVARQLAELGNALQSAKLIRIADQVAEMENRIAAWKKTIAQMERNFGDGYSEEAQP